MKAYRFTGRDERQMPSAVKLWVRFVGFTVVPIPLLGAAVSYLFGGLWFFYALILAALILLLHVVILPITLAAANKVKRAKAAWAARDRSQPLSKIAVTFIITKIRILWRLGIELAAEYRETRSSARALADQIGTWPKVTHSGRHGYLIKASFSSPRRAKWPDRIAVAAGFVIFFVAIGNLQVMWPGDRDTEGFRIFAVLIGSMIAAWATKFLWIGLCKVHLKIDVEGGGARWIGPRGKVGHIQPGEAYEVTAQSHHLGPEEIRVQNENIRRGAIKQKEKTLPAYQVASEIVAKTGVRKHIVWPVAEIMPDIAVTKAAALAAALDIAIQENRKSIQHAEAKRRATTGTSGTGSLDDE